MSDDKGNLEALSVGVGAVPPGKTSMDGHPDALITSAPINPAEFYEQVGHMTRNLHNALTELGLDKPIQSLASTMPDTMDRLTYVATLTQQAAERVLNAVDVANPAVEGLLKDAERLEMRWSQLLSGEMTLDAFKLLAQDTRAHLEGERKAAKIVASQLLDIMMAQDFQDLTGQVIKKIIDIVQVVQKELLALLVAQSVVPLPELSSSLTNGPVVNSAGRTDIVTNQGEVDDLLASLGF